MAVVLHGVPISQPVRAVYWGCCIKKLKVAFRLVSPGLPSGHRYSVAHPAFVDKFPLGLVPALEDGPVRIGESTAILPYLADKHGWDDLYPKDLAQRARVNQYLHWHHSHIRAISMAHFFPRFRLDASVPKDVIEHYTSRAQSGLEKLDSALLSTTPFIDSQAPTIADLVAYEEVAQVGPRFGQLFTFNEFPNVKTWLKRMEQLPFHDQVHDPCLGALGSFGDTTDVRGRLVLANKQALASIKEFQDSLGSL